jgi:hypothetical protein
MMTRSRSETVIFNHPFLLKGVDRTLPAGDYRVVTDEELIEELSFPVYRRVATMIFVPGAAHRSTSVEMVTIDPSDLRTAQERDAAIQHASMANAAADLDMNHAAGRSPMS